MSLYFPSGQGEHETLPKAANLPAWHFSQELFDSEGTLPGSQGVQKPFPKLEENVPDEHLLQVMPSPYSPAVHVSQDLSVVDVQEPDSYWPEEHCAQRVHPEAPAIEYVPDIHETQPETSVAPNFEKVPAAQSLHFVVVTPSLISSILYVPGPQESQDEAPLLLY